MLIASSKLYHLLVLDPETHARLGTVEKLIFDAELGKLAAFAVQTNGLVRRTLFASVRDISSFEPHAIICSAESLYDLKELPRIRQLVANRTPLLNQTAVTIHKKSLGRVKEVLIDDCAFLIMQIHTRHLFDSRIFGRDALQKVTRKHVILVDDEAETSDTVLAGETAHA